jgi:integrase/recombinase XerD
MSLVTSQPQEFASLLQRFFIERLMQQQNASGRIIS